MSFGYSASDIIICIQLVRKVWQDCRDAPKEFKAVALEVEHLELLLNGLKDQVHDFGLDQRQTEDFKRHIKGFSGVLKDLECLL